MKYQFIGSLGQLKDLVTEKGFAGSWKYQRLSTGGILHMFRGKDGSALNWWESTRTVLVQGQTLASQNLFDSIKDYLQENSKEEHESGQGNADSFEYDE